MRAAREGLIVQLGLDFLHFAAFSLCNDASPVVQTPYDCYRKLRSGKQTWDEAGELAARRVLTAASFGRPESRNLRHQRLAAALRSGKADLVSAARDRSVGTKRAS